MKSSLKLKQHRVWALLKNHLSSQKCLFVSHGERCIKQAHASLPCPITEHSHYHPGELKPHWLIAQVPPNHHTSLVPPSFDHPSGHHQHVLKRWKSRGYARQLQEPRLAITEVSKSPEFCASILITQPNTPTSKSKHIQARLSHPSYFGAGFSMLYCAPCSKAQQGSAVWSHRAGWSYRSLKMTHVTHQSGLLDFIFTSAKYSACPGANLLVALTSGNSQSPKGIKS